MAKASYRWLFGFLVLLTSLLLAGSAIADGGDSIHLVIDDQTVLSDVPPVNIGGRILLPARIVAERLGGISSWDPQTKQVHILRRTDEVVLTIDSDIALVNGKSTKLDVPATIVDGRTMVPIRFVATALGATVRYDNNTRTAFIWRRPTSITGISWQKEVGQARITLQLSEPLTYHLQQNQGSFVLDLSPAVLSVQQPVNVLADPLFKSISLFQTGERAVHLEVGTYTSVTPAVALSPDGTQLTLTLPYQVLGSQFVQDGNVPTVLIPTSGPVAYTTTSLGGPDRLVVEIPNATVADGVAGEASGGSLIKRIRTAQYTKDSVRVVLDLSSQQPYQVVQTRAGLMIRFTPVISAITYRDQGNGTAALNVQTNLPVTFSVSQTADSTGALTISIPGVHTDLPDDQTVGPVKIHLDHSQGHDGVTVTAQLPYYLGHTVAANPAPTGPSLSLITSPIYGKKIWIDPGHGGTDPGAIGPGGHKEKDVTFGIAQKLRKLLQAAGAVVYMSDPNVDFRDRPDLVNPVKPDMFLSIHLNSATSPDAHGTETYYWTTNPKSKALATAIQSAMTDGVGLTDRGVRTEDYWVITKTWAPSSLVEVGFISNSTEERLFATDAMQEKTAEALRQGIFRFFLGK